MKSIILVAVLAGVSLGTVQRADAQVVVEVAPPDAYIASVTPEYYENRPVSSTTTIGTTVTTDAGSTTGTSRGISTVGARTGAVAEAATTVPSAAAITAAARGITTAAESRSPTTTRRRG